MKRSLFLLALIGCAVPRLEDRIRVLTDDSFEGRMTGTEGERRAGEYIASSFRGLGIEPTFQDFEGHGIRGRNVLARIHGTSPEAVVIGAHYDHLGKMKGEICPGADDNASGTAVLLDMAGRFARRPARRTILLIAFSGEELGLFGSRHYVKHPIVPIDQTVAMINLDMVGRLRKELIIFGADSGDRFKEYLSDSPIPIAYGKEPVGPSDHTSFYLGGVPAVHLFTGSHSDYHRPSDRDDKINYAGLRHVADLVETLARRIADAPERMAYVKVAFEAARITSDGRPYFGSMPDYGFAGKGVRLAGVTPDSPAARAGMNEGDVIVSLNGKDIPDVNVYASILFSLHPGDSVEVGFEREGERRTVKATLTQRAEPEK